MIWGRLVQLLRCWSTGLPPLPPCWTAVPCIRTRYHPLQSCERWSSPRDFRLQSSCPSSGSKCHQFCRPLSVEMRVEESAGCGNAGSCECNSERSRGARKMSQPAFSLTPTQRTQRYARLQERCESPLCLDKHLTDRSWRAIVRRPVPAIIELNEMAQHNNVHEKSRILGKLAGARFRGRPARSQSR